MPKKLFGHCATLTPSGTELLVTGGFSEDDDDYSGLALAFNFETEVWKVQDFRLNSPRYDHVCSLVLMRAQIQVGEVQLQFLIRSFLVF